MLTILIEIRSFTLPIKNSYNNLMRENSLLQTNRYLKDSDKARQLKTRSIASSTAIETGESIKTIEQKINHLHSSASRVTLA